MTGWTGFGFKVKQPRRWDASVGKDVLTDPEMWVVSLPHQCDRWEITSTKHEDAVEELKSFIDEASKALAALERREEVGVESWEVDE